jgi:hypothetical protein
VALGSLFLLGIPAILATLNAGKSAFRWWWPTNWMIVPAIIVAVGLVLVVVPLRRPKRSAPVAPPPVSTTLRGGGVTENSVLQIDTTADRFADGTTFSGNSRVTVRHRPRRPGQPDE